MQSVARLKNICQKNINTLFNTHNSNRQCFREEKCVAIVTEAAAAEAASIGAVRSLSTACRNCLPTAAPLCAFSARRRSPI